MSFDDGSSISEAFPLRMSTHIASDGTVSTDRPTCKTNDCSLFSFAAVVFSLISFSSASGVIPSAPTINRILVVSQHILNVSHKHFISSLCRSFCLHNEPHIMSFSHLKQYINSFDFSPPSCNGSEPYAPHAYDCHLERAFGVGSFGNGLYNPVSKTTQGLEGPCFVLSLDSLVPGIVDISNKSAFLRVRNSTKRPERSHLVRVKCLKSRNRSKRTARVRYLPLCAKDATARRVRLAVDVLGAPADVVEDESIKISCTLATANVCTFHEFNDTKTESYSSRRLMIIEQCHRAALTIIGMQETRSPATRISVVNNYIIISSATDKNRFYGCEIWVSCKFSVASCSPSVDSFVLIHSDPQILLVSMQLGSFICFLCTFHAPQNEAKDLQDKTKIMSTADRAKWWNKLSKILSDLDPAVPLFCLADANATVGSQPSTATGGLDPEPPNKNSEFFVKLLHKVRLTAPATFENFHSGPSGTHTSINNKSKRIDYVLIPESLNAFNAKSFTAEVDLDIFRADHVVPAFTFEAFFCCNQSPCVKHRVCICDRDLIKSPDAAEQFIHNTSMYITPYNIDTYNVCDNLTSMLQSSASDAFPMKRCAPRDKWLSSFSWSCIQKCKRSRRVRATSRARWNRLAKSAVFNIFKHMYKYKSVPCFSLHRTCSTSLGNIGTTIVILNFVLIVLQHKLRICSRNDWKAHVEAVAWKAFAASIKPRFDSKALFGFVKQMSKKSTRIPKAIQMSNGIMAQSHSQIASKWQQHFADLFLGKQTSWQELADAQSDLHMRLPPASKEDFFKFDLSKQLVDQVFKSFKRGKAFGKDSLPPDLFAQFHDSLAFLATPLYRSAFYNVREPLQFKGGVIMDLLKKAGFATQCSSSRGILISDILGKGYRKCVRSFLLPYAEEYALDSQCGSLAHKGSDFASHYLNAALEYIHFNKLSFICLFADLIAAFDSVMHSFIVDLPVCDESISYLMSRLNLPIEAFHDLCKQLHEQHALAQAEVPSHLQNVAIDVLSNNWFLIENSDRPCSINRSTKQGDPTADLFFNFFMARVLKTIRRELESNNLGIQIPHTDLQPLGVCDACQFTDASYVDDTFFIHAFRDNENTTKYAELMVAIVCKALCSHALQPNFKKGKSEFCINLRGPKSKQMRKVIFVDLDSLIPCKVYDSLTVRVHVVLKYKHLGNFATGTRTNVARAKHRVGEAMSALIPLSRNVLRSPIIPVLTKTLVAKSLILSKLYYNVCVWSAISQAQTAMFRRFVLKVIRNIARFGHTNPVSDEKLLCMIDIPEPHIHIRTIRLIYYIRFIKYAPKTLKSLVAASAKYAGSWIRTVSADLLWLIRHTPQLHKYNACNLSSKDFNEYLVSTLCVSHIHDASTNHAEKFEVPASKSAAEPHKCPHCPREFENKQKLSGHLYKAHNVKHPARLYASADGVCKVCLKLFHTRPRLIHHLRQSSHSCLNSYMSCIVPFTPVEVESLDQSDRNKSRELKQAGFTKLHAAKPVVSLHGPMRPLIKLSCTNEGLPQVS